MRTPDDVWDLGFSFLPVEDDANPPTLCFLTSNPDDVDRGPDIEDPADPDYDRYPWGDAATLMVDDFVRRAAAHWQRLNPSMRRFTEGELTNAAFLGGLGHVRAGLEFLVKARPGFCSFIEEHAFEWENYV